MNGIPFFWMWAWAMLVCTQLVSRDTLEQENMDTFCNCVRIEVKASGMLDTPDNCWEFFVEKVSLNGFFETLTHTMLFKSYIHMYHDVDKIYINL